MILINLHNAGRPVNLFILIGGLSTVLLSNCFTTSKNELPNSTTKQEHVITEHKQMERPNEDMVFVEGGVFTMGATPEDGSGFFDAEPAHEVSLKSFYMDRYEVSNEQYAAFLTAYGSNTVKSGDYVGQLMIGEFQWNVQKKGNKWIVQNGYEKHPVANVTWYGANEYARYYGMRLPSEAEWEFAAKGGKESKGFKYAGGNKIEEVAWYSSNSEKKIHVIGTKKSNELGIYDMSGNVWEWCADTAQEDYSGAPKDGSAWVESGKGKKRITRGGAWLGFEENCRVIYRARNKPDDLLVNVGFRLCRH